MEWLRNARTKQIAKVGTEKTFLVKIRAVIFPGRALGISSEKRFPLLDASQHSLEIEPLADKLTISRTQL